MRLFFLLFVSVALLSGCSVNKRLAPFNSALAQAAADVNMPAEKKLEILAVNLTGAMAESLVFANPKKTGQFLERFSKQNEDAVLKIIGDMDKDVKSRSLTNRISFFAETTKKPYIKDFRQTGKKVEKRIGRKIKTISLFAKALNFLNPLKKNN